MTGGGDLDQISDDALVDVSDDVLDEPDDDEIDEEGGTGDGEADAPVGRGVQLDESDPDPTAGASDVGGVPGGIDEDDARGDDAHEVGGGHSGMDKGPTGS
jgi:hypothetical protein